jgi:hypothetical protein
MRNERDMASFSGEPTSENAWLEEVCRGRFESRDSDEVTVTGNAEVVGCGIPTAGETDVATWQHISNHELRLLSIL